MLSTLTAHDVSRLCAVPLRTAQRRLAEWRDKGIAEETRDARRGRPALTITPDALARACGIPLDALHALDD